MQRYFVVDNLPKAGRVNTFLCYVTGKRGNVNFLNCQIDVGRRLYIKDYEKLGTLFFLVRLFVMPAPEREENYPWLQTKFLADSKSFEYVPILLPKRFPTNEIMVRIRNSGEESPGINLALKSIRKAVFVCLRDGLDMSDCCDEVTQEEFEQGAALEKEEVEAGRQAGLRFFAKRCQTNALCRAFSLYSDLNDEGSAVSIAYKKLSMSYEKFVKYLIEEHGPVTGDYFKNEDCRSKNTSIARGREGLFVHHVREDIEPLLSGPVMARMKPFEFQKAENLVYCDILEHLMLHILLLPIRTNELDAVLMQTNMGLRLIYEQINDCFFGIDQANRFRKAVMDSLEGQFDAYIATLTFLLCYVEEDTRFAHPELIDQFCRGFDGKIVESVRRALTANYQAIEEHFLRSDRKV